MEPQQHQQHAELAHQDLSQEERWAQQAPEPWQGLPPMPEPSLPPPPEQLPQQQLSSQAQPPSEQPQPSWQPQQPQSSVAPPQQQQQPALQQQPSLPQSQAQPASAAAPLAAAGYEPAPHRSKKGRRGGRSGSEPRDLVHLSGPIPRDSERLAAGWRPVRLSDEEKAAQVGPAHASLLWVMSSWRAMRAQDAFLPFVCKSLLWCSGLRLRPTQTRLLPQTNLTCVALQVVLDDSRLGASFTKGYRMVSFSPTLSHWDSPRGPVDCELGGHTTKRRKEEGRRGPSFMPTEAVAGAGWQRLVCPLGASKGCDACKAAEGF